MARRVEVLIARDLIDRGREMLQAMVRAAPAAGVRCVVVPHYTGRTHNVMAYGLGHPGRRPVLQQHVEKGGRLIGWDLGYWHRRIGAEFSMRMTVDADHPQAWIAPEEGSRWDAAGIRLREDYREDGPILLCGMGWKSKRAYAGNTNDWEVAMAKRLAKAYPGRLVKFKPKRDVDPGPPGLPVARGSIEDELRGASLLVCRHSNVAVDACIAGVPVVCEDGAAAAIYGADVSAPRRPSRDERLAFLRSLAWWQYRPSEAGLAWKYLKDRGFV